MGSPTMADANPPTIVPLLNVTFDDNNFQE
jgi:hypothetical protein